MFLSKAVIANNAMLARISEWSIDMLFFLQGRMFAIKRLPPPKSVANIQKCSHTYLNPS